MITSRHLKLILLTALVGATFFLASFNATIRLIVDQQRTSSSSSSSGSQLIPTAGDDATNNNDDATILPADAIEEEEEGGGGQEQNHSEAKLNGLQQQQQQRRRRRNTKTTTRPLDGFAQDATFIDHTTKTEKKYLQRRPPTASAATTTPTFEFTDRVVSAADAHYAKAMRMLSSPFDQLKLNHADDNEIGGNALPHPIYGGEYDQGGVGGSVDGTTSSRGNKFVQMEDYYYHSFGKPGEMIDNTYSGAKKLNRKISSRTRQRQKLAQRRRRLRRNSRRRRQQRDDGTTVAAAAAAAATTSSGVDDAGGGDNNNNGGTNHDDDHDHDEVAFVLEEISEFVLEYYEGILGWIYDTLGYITNSDTPDTDDYEDDDDDDDENAIDDAYHYFYHHHRHQDLRPGVGAVVDDDTPRDGNYILSWRGTSVGKRLYWTYTKVASLWYHRQRREDSTTDARRTKTTTTFGKGLRVNDHNPCFPRKSFFILSVIF
jgi:hypothetical protein